MNIKTSDDTVYDTSVRLLILFGVIAWCVLIMNPFISIILWSLVLAIAFYPLHKMLSGKMGGKPKLASFIIIFSILAVIIIPAGLLINSLIAEFKELRISYDSGSLAVPVPPEKIKEWPLIGEKVYNFWHNLNTNLEHLVVRYKDELLEFAKSLAKGILNSTGDMIQILLSLIIAGVLLAKGVTVDAVRKFFRKVGGDRGDEFADLTFKTVGSVVKGVIGEALILSLLHGVLFFLAGIPYAGIWTLLVFIFAVLQIPVFFITVPVMIYFFSVKELMPAILWSVSLLLVTFSDNILTPLMLGKSAPVPMPVIFIGVIGGLMLTGFIGLFTGAVIISIGYTLLAGWINTAPSKTENPT